MKDALVVLITVPDRETGERIAAELVGEHLAACVSVSGPITSVYRWRGETHHDDEWLLTVKTRRACYDELEHRVIALHPYDVPEVIAVPVVLGSAPYLAWLRAETNATPAG